MNIFTRKEFDTATDFVRKQIVDMPDIGIILGSGLGDLADTVSDAKIISYEMIPHWPLSTVVGHSGQLHIGSLEAQSVLVMRGRSHFYEGYPMSQITLPIRVMQLLGVKILILTNAAGGVNPDFNAGDVMLITDHINFTGSNPLIGPNDDSLGPRFPDMSNVYDKELRRLAVGLAEENEIPLQQGVYAGFSGPSFETPAEIRYMRTIGADAVGMSTVPEALVARHGGLRVLGFSGISNVAIDNTDSEAEATHEEVLEAGKVIVPRLTQLLKAILGKVELE